MSEPEKTATKVYNSLIKRAERSRNEGLIYVAVIIVIASLIIATFVFAPPSWSIIVTNNIEPVNIHAEQAQPSWSSIVTSVILRLGAVVLAVFLIQIFVSLTRYRFRVAEHLSLCADALLLSGDDTDKFKILSNTLSAKSFDFGKLPNSPYVEITQAIRDGISKATTK